MAWGMSNTGGGGGLLANAAVLAVTAPVGSTITISKDSTSKTQDASNGHTSADDASLAVWYFSVRDFGTWTVTAVIGADTKTSTITINSVAGYEIEVGFHDLYNNGDYSIVYSHEARRSNATVTDEDSYIQQSQTGNNYYAYTRWQAVDLTKYSSITFEGETYDASSITNGAICYLFVTQNSNVNLGKDATLSAWGDIGRSNDYVDFTLTLDVSNLTGSWYVAAGHDSQGNQWPGQRRCRVKKVRLEQ